MPADDRAAYCERQRELLAAGWHRVYDPAREHEFPADPHDAALEQAIREHPDDDQPWLVYADLLIERGHPRGPLVALESAPVRNIVQRAEREAEARRLRHAMADRFGHGLVGRPGLSVQWRRGFIHRAKLHGGFMRGDAEDLLFDLLRHPCARFLRELEIACWHTDAQDHRLLGALLLHAASPPPLRKLAIVYPSLEWTGFPPVGDLGPLGAVYPQLEDVRIEADDTARFEGLALARAQRFAVEIVGLRSAVLRPIAIAAWPVLEELELWFRDSTCTADDLRFVLGLPRLARLRVLAAPFANELVELIAASPLAPQLVTLDLRHGAFDARGASALLAARARFHDELELRMDSARVPHDLRVQLRDANIDIGWW